MNVFWSTEKFTGDFKRFIYNCCEERHIIISWETFLFKNLEVASSWRNTDVMKECLWSLNFDVFVFINEVLSSRLILFVVSGDCSSRHNLFDRLSIYLLCAFAVVGLVIYTFIPLSLSLNSTCPQWNKTTIYILWSSNYLFIARQKA